MNRLPVQKTSILAANRRANAPDVCNYICENNDDCGGTSYDYIHKECTFYGNDITLNNDFYHSHMQTFLKNANGPMSQEFITKRINQIIYDYDELSDELLKAHSSIISKIDTRDYNIRAAAGRNPNTRYETVNLIMNEEYAHAAPEAPFTIDEATRALQWLESANVLLSKLATQEKILQDVVRQLHSIPDGIEFTIQEIGKKNVLLARQREYLLPQLRAFRAYLILMDASKDFDVIDPVLNEIKTLTHEQINYGRIIPEETNRAKKMRLHEAQQLLYILQQKINVTKRRIQSFIDTNEFDLLPEFCKNELLIKMNK